MTSGVPTWRTESIVWPAIRSMVEDQLEAIIEPSKVISDQYGSSIVTLNDAAGQPHGVVGVAGDGSAGLVLTDKQGKILLRKGWRRGRGGDQGRSTP